MRIDASGRPRLVYPRAAAMKSCPSCGRPSDVLALSCAACGASFGVGALPDPDNDPLVGVTLPGGYEIIDLVGVGGMGRVYRAAQNALGRTVAVKLVHPHLAGDANTSARFINEARAASRLNHPNSVAIIDFGRTPEGQLYLVMEFLRGRDLARVVHEDGALPLARVVDIVRQVLAALGDAHLLSIVHRDLKPENVIVEPSRTGRDLVKVVDFGLAKTLEGDAASQRSITAPGIVCGTPDYMAPEQGRGDATDPRSDLYGVGVMLFQLITGRLPFVGDSPTEVVLMHLSAPAPDPRRIAPERHVPASLADVVRRALEKSPEDRWQTADEFAAALEATLPDLLPLRIASSARCGVCGASLPAASRFCPACGERIGEDTRDGRSATREAPAEPAAPDLPSLPLPFAGRSDEVAWVAERRTEVRGTLVAARIVGEAGAGKTRLLHEVGEKMRAAGDVVVVVRPDPWGAEVGNYVVRRAIATLAGLPVGGGDESAWPRDDADARLGLAEVFRSRDVAAGNVSPHARRDATAAALVWALRKALAGARAERVVLMLDDYDCADGASRAAFAELVSAHPSVPALVLAAHAPRFDPRWPESCPARLVAGIAASHAARIVAGVTIPREVLAADPSGRVAPLYLDQLVRFVAEGGSDPPVRLSDLVLARLERVPSAARHVLQVIAVLGEAPELREVQALVPEGAMVRATTKSVGASVIEGVATLVAAGLVERDGDTCRVAHPLVRELVHAATPAAVRRDLYARAARLAEVRGLPLEVRARRNVHGGRPLEALLQLDRLADRAAARGDLATAASALRTGVDVVRSSGADLDDPERALLLFSRKLGDTLARAGELADAEAVLREAIALAPPATEERARALGALAGVASRLGRKSEAASHLAEAISLAMDLGATSLAADLRAQGALHER